MNTGVTLADIIQYLVVIILGAAGGTGGWAFLQFVLNRRGVQAEAGRVEAEAELKRQEVEKAKQEREAALKELERKAYLWSEEAATRRFKDLTDDYERCRTEVAKVRNDGNEMRLSIAALVEALDAIMSRVIPKNGDDVLVTVSSDEISTIRSALRDTRRHLH